MLGVRKDREGAFLGAVTTPSLEGKLPYASRENKALQSGDIFRRQLGDNLSFLKLVP